MNWGFGVKKVPPPPTPAKYIVHILGEREQTERQLAFICSLMYTSRRLRTSSSSQRALLERTAPSSMA